MAYRNGLRIYNIRHMLVMRSEEVDMVDEWMGWVKEWLALFS
jgi:hypothetical protein